jgi:predicted ester cyclase
VVKILERWFDEVWNKGNEAAIDELLAPDDVIHHLLDGDGEKVTDVPAFKKMFRTFRSALSEINVVVEHEVTEGDMSAARCTVTAVHSGDGLDRVPLNKPIHFTGMSMVRVRDGKIVESWNHFDFETMYQQME